MKKIKIACSAAKDNTDRSYTADNSSDSLIKVHRDPTNGPPRHDLRKLRKDEDDPHLKLD